MPFPRDVLEVHESRLRRRAERDGVPFGHDLAVSSVYELSEPLSKLMSDKWTPRRMRRFLWQYHRPHAHARGPIDCSARNRFPMSMLSVRVWRGGAARRRLRRLRRAAASGADGARRRHAHPAAPRSDARLSLRLPRRHVRLVRDDRQRHARAGRAARTSKRSPGTASLEIAPLAQPAGDSRSRHRHARVLRQVGARQGAVRPDGDAP